MDEIFKLIELIGFIKEKDNNTISTGGRKTFLYYLPSSQKGDWYRYRIDMAYDYFGNIFRLVDTDIRDSVYNTSYTLVDDKSIEDIINLLKNTFQYILRDKKINQII